MKIFVRGLLGLFGLYMLFILIQVIGFTGSVDESILNVIIYFAVFSASLLLGAILLDYYVKNQLERILLMVLVLFCGNYFIQVFVLDILDVGAYIMMVPPFTLKLIFTEMHHIYFIITDINVFLQTPVLISVFAFVVMVGLIVYRKIIKHD